GGLLTVLCAGLLAGTLFDDEKASALAMIFCAFCTPIWFYSGTFLETTLAAFFATLSLWLFLKWKETPGEIPKMVLCGALTGLAILFREEGFVFAFGLVLAAGILCFSWKRLLAYGVGAALLVLPLLIWNYADSGSIFGMHHKVYTHLTGAGDGFLSMQLKNMSFYLFLLCLPFLGELNMVIPWILLGGIVLRLIPKLRKGVEVFYFLFAGVCCGASLWCNLRTEHGGVFLYQSLLDHLPLFALFLLCLPVLLKKETQKEIRFLAVIALAGIVLPPLLLQYDQPGMFWGGRHFLNVIPILCILCVFLLKKASNVSRIVKIGGWALAVLSFAANLAGYGVLKTKREFSARYVREIAKPEYKVILTDMFWMPEEFSWIHREKCVLLLTSPDALDRVCPFLRANGIRQYHLLLGKNYRLIRNESLRNALKSVEIEPGAHFRHHMLGFFECQLFLCTEKPSPKPTSQGAQDG
ncbi:MAG: glycosyltransferase family 39 protein, partial [Lentisphaeria bacterium]|nr:glycosyltransferase family 39 protein [Lentisphaeria bacterium]